MATRAFHTKLSNQYPKYILFLWLIFNWNFLLAQEKGDSLVLSNLKKMSMEELMGINVTSVSKTPEVLMGTASAIQVITSEDIQRSSATRLPEALRLATNLQVAQSSSHGWAITSRGFNGAPLTSNSLADKLLVMIDGRSIYTPLFSGVFWDVQNVLMEDIDRIEVISGPGGTIWGANAVNGVINILRKHSKETQGIYITGAVGSFMEGHAGFRYGGKAGENLYYRVYLQHMQYDNTMVLDTIDAMDDWHTTQLGFRVDYEPSNKNQLVIQGDFYSGEESGPDDSDLDGQNMLVRLTHTFNKNSNLSLQVYFDRTWRKQHSSDFHEELNTYDIDFHHTIRLGDMHRIVWGAGYRYMQDELNNAATLVFSPEDLDFDFTNLFLQDEIQLFPKFRFIIGTKLSDNFFSGFGIQPNVRIAWTPNEDNTLWFAVSRALRSAGRFDADVSFPIQGKERFNWESVTAYEAGYRVIPSEDLSISLATFYNNYRDLRSIDLMTTGIGFDNHQKATSYGLELSIRYQINEWWRLRSGYTYLNRDIESTSDAVIDGSDTFEAIDPDHQILIQSIIDLPVNLSFDITARYVDNLPSSTLGGIVLEENVPEYYNMDVRIAWHIGDLQLALVGQNLFKELNHEFGAFQVPRSIYGRISWRLEK